MKIKSVTPHVIAQKLDAPFGMSQWDWDVRASCLVEITTDDGLTGWGECFGPAPSNRELIESVFAPMIIGRDPSELVSLWEAMYNRNREWGRRGISIAAISGIEIALWDLAGKSAGLPVYKLIGGSASTQVNTYASAFYYGGVWAGDVEAEAQSLVVAGYSAVKMKVGRSMRSDITRVQQVRSALGPDIRLAVDANRGFTTQEAITFERELRDCGIWFFEEPVIPEDLDGYRELRTRSAVPIAGGESEFTRWGFRDLIETRSVDILQPDATACGGIRETLLIAGMASTHAISTIPHVWGTSITVAAGLHLLTAMPTVTPSVGREAPFLELDQAPNAFREGLSGIAVGPVMSTPTGPGLGITVDRSVIDRYSIAPRN